MSATRSGPPLLEAAVAELLSPAEAPGLDAILAAVPQLPRYLGPEAWLEAMAALADQESSVAPSSEAGLYSRMRKENTW